MFSHAVWKTWPSGLSNDKNLVLRPRFLSTESPGPCFSHSTGDHDQILHQMLIMHDVDEVWYSTMIWKLIELILCHSDARFLIRSVQNLYQPTTATMYTPTEYFLCWNTKNQDIMEVFEPVMIWNTLRSRQNGCQFTDIFKCISFNENFWILNEIPLKYAPRDLIDNMVHWLR